MGPDNKNDLKTDVLETPTLSAENPSPAEPPGLEMVDFSSEWSVIINDPDSYWTVAGGK